MTTTVRSVLKRSEMTVKKQKGLTSRGQYFLDALFEDEAYARYLANYEGYGPVEANWKDPMFGNSSLHSMVYSDSTAQVRLLLGCGADPSSRNRNNETPLHWA